MRRRDVIGLAGAAAAWPLLARGQEPKTWRIGFLGAPSAAAYARLVAALRAGLRELGYIEGNNLVIEFRWANGDYKRLPALATELCRLKPDVIVTHGTPGALAAERATTSIPIVMAIIGDPIVTGVVSSIRKPNKNITGSTFFSPQLAAKRVEFLKQAVPLVRRVGLLSNPDNAVMTPTLATAGETAHALGIELEPFDVRGATEFKATFTAMVAKRIEAVLIPEDGITVANARAIGALCIANRLPAIGFKDVALGGALLAYGVNIPNTFRRAAVFVDKIFKGARPEDLPIEEATKFEFVINLKAARTLEVAIPPTLLAAADEVIE